MNDLEKLEEIYKILDKAARDIGNLGELSDYGLDCEVDKIYNKLDDLQTDIYGLIQEIGE